MDRTNVGKSDGRRASGKWQGVGCGLTGPISQEDLLSRIALRDEEVREAYIDDLLQEALSRQTGMM